MPKKTQPRSKGQQSSALTALLKKIKTDGASAEELAAEWKAVRNNADTYCVGIEDGDDDYIYINKILEKGKLLGWRVRKEEKVFGDLPADYDMAKFGFPVELEEAGSFKKIAKEWEKIKKNPKAYYIAITDDDGLYLDTFIHKILRNGELAGWRVREDGKPSVDLPANYDMARFGFPGDVQEIEDELLCLEFFFDVKNFTTPPASIGEFAKNPAFIKSVKSWEKDVLDYGKQWLSGEG